MHQAAGIYIPHHSQTPTPLHSTNQMLNILNLMYPRCQMITNHPLNLSETSQEQIHASFAYRPPRHQETFSIPVLVKLDIITSKRDKMNLAASTDWHLAMTGNRQKFRHVKRNRRANTLLKIINRWSEYLQHISDVEISS